VVTSRLASLAAHSSFFVVKTYVPHLLLIAEIQQVGPGRSVVRGNFAIASGYLLNEVENPPFQRIVTSFGAFCDTCVSSTPFREGARATSDRREA
jgi:hypothetical protein